MIEALLYSRSHYPETNPLVCLAFVSHKRIDLLTRSINAAIKHMEKDEPSYMTYEIAWFDNGSGDDAQTFHNENNIIEHVLLSDVNKGLPHAINMLTRKLCTAPYILYLEEDWEFGGDSSYFPGGRNYGFATEYKPSPGAPSYVLPVTKKRNHIISTSISLLKLDEISINGLNDKKHLLGIFLRSDETLEAKIKFPYKSNWNKIKSLQTSFKDSNNESFIIDNIEYRTYCMDSKSSIIWGAYSNGATIYNRQNLINIGPMYGDPKDIVGDINDRIHWDSHMKILNSSFPSHQAEANYAFRAGLKYCSASLKLDSNNKCKDSNINNIQIQYGKESSICTSAFIHIGVDRGYGLEKKSAAKLNDDNDKIWMLLGTPFYDLVIAFNQVSIQLGRDEVMKWLQLVLPIGMESNLAKNVASNNEFNNDNINKKLELLTNNNEL